MSEHANNDVTLLNQKSQNKEADALFKLFELLNKADTENKLAGLNETTMSDNNGGRIEL